MTKKEFSWYLLSNAPGFGAKSIHFIYKRLKEKNMTINDLFDMEINELIKLFPEFGHSKFSKANFSCLPQLVADEKLIRDFERLKSNGITIIGIDDDKYPKSFLKKLGDSAPPIIYCKGYLPLLNQTGFSIVGSRDVSDFEIITTKKIAKSLAEFGFNIISGYARGIDTSAHLGALEAGGTTTMILSFGMNHIRINSDLKDFDLEKNALFVTQFSPFEKFSGRNAMIRNKLVCAMSKAMIVIKSGPEKDISGKMSGTFDAGKSALKMGIPVFVLSPQIFSPPPKGNIELIKLGGVEFLNEMEIFKFFEEHLGQEILTLNKINELKVTSKNETVKNSIEPYKSSLFD